MLNLQIIYGLDDRPPLGRAVVLALQHTLTMFGTTMGWLRKVLSPVVIGPVIMLIRTVLDNVIPGTPEDRS